MILRDRLKIILEYFKLIENFSTCRLLPFSTKQTWSTHFPITFKYFLIFLCYVKCQNILINVLVHQLEHLSFRFICTSSLLLKFATQLKLIQSVVHEFNSQDPALTILVLRVASPKFQGLRYRVLGVRVPCHRFPGPKFLDPSSQGPGLKSWF